MRGYPIILTLLCFCCVVDQSQAQERPVVDSITQAQKCAEHSELPGMPETFQALDAQAPQIDSSGRNPRLALLAGPAQLPDTRSERGLTSMSNRFIPKGQWIFGLSGSYSTHTNKGYNFLVIDDINSDGYTVKVSPLVAYAIRDNMAVGARFIYSRSLLRVDSGKIDLGDDDTGIELGTDFYYALQHNYSVALIWRQYIPLGQNKRFALFNEAQLTLGGGQARFAADSPIRGTYETNFTCSLGISPGLVAFATNNLAFEVNIGVMGLSYTRTRQVHNQVVVGSRSSSMMNFKINLFSIGLGVSFYL